MKAIGRVVYHDPRTYGYTITRRWAIPEDWSDNKEMWWYRDEWLDATNPAEPGETVYVDVYPGGWAFMEKVILCHKRLGWRVVYKELAGYVPYDVVLDRALYTG